MKISILSGSPRQYSITARLAFFVKSELNHLGFDAEIIDVRDYELKMIQTVWTSENLVPEEFLSLYKKMKASDAFVFVSPEYNGSYSPALKNLLDHFPKQTFSRKAIGIVTASTGAMGGMRAAQQMQQMICAFFGIPSPHMMLVPLVDQKFSEEGQLMEEQFRNSSDRFFSEFIWLASTLNRK